MWRLPHHRTFRAAVVIGLLAGLIAAIAPVPIPADATSIVPFAARFSANDNGSIAVFGNSLMVCPPAAADCAAARAATVQKNNNNYNMVHADLDGASFATYSSSEAAVTLPEGATVRWAGLYWGARLRAGTGGAAAVGDGRQMKLRAPGDADYRTITANRLFGPSTTPDRAYQSFADVTSIVTAAGPGSYFGADVPAGTGEDRYAGWSLVVVFRSPALPLRNLTVFDGFADVGQNDPQIVTISGFRTPVSGQVNARIGLVAYEGDLGSSGDRAILRSASKPDGTLLSTAISPGTNFFNGTNDENGRLVTARTPADRNMLGFDIKNLDGPGILGNGETSARLDLASTSERYFPGVVTTAVDLFAPDFSPSTKIVENLTGGVPARVGDRVRYTATFVNAGQDPATNWSILDPVPPGATFVPGSIDVEGTGTGTFQAGANAIAVTPSPGSDRFEIGESLTLSFEADLTAAAASTDVANTATITYDSASVPELADLTFATPAAAIAVVATADLVLEKTNTPNPVVAGGVLTSTITVRNDGPSPATDVVVTDQVPAGLIVTAVPSQGGPCRVAGDTVTCPIGTLAAGATATVTVSATVPPDATAAALTDVAQVSSTTADPVADNNTAGASAELTRNADLSITKTADSGVVAPGGTVRYTIIATNNGPSTAADVAVSDAVAGSGVTLSAATSPQGACVVEPNSARCSIPTLAPGASATMTVDALVGAGVAGGTVLENTATASSATPDDDPSDNSATVQVTTSEPVSVLAVSKSAVAPTPLLAGLGEVRYTIEIRNDGPSDATTVTVDDVLPPGFAVVSASSNRGSCTVAAAPSGDTVACDLGGLLAPVSPFPGATATISIVAAVGPGVAAGTYPNSATAQAGGGAPVASNDAPVNVEAQADLNVVKSFPEGTADPTIVPGQPKTYRIRVANFGPSVAFGASVVDELPALIAPTAWRVTSVTPPGAVAPVCSVVTISCAIGDLPPGAVVEFELDVLASPALVIDPDVGVVNSATATSATPDPNPGDNTSTFTVGGGAQADLSIRKIGPSLQRELTPVNAPVAGTNTSYILEIINFGPSFAPGLVVTDVLPPGVRFVRDFDPLVPEFDPPFCTGDGGTPETVTCDLSFIPAPGFPAFVGTNLGIEVALDPTIPDGTVLENTATITSDALDGNLGNNTSTTLTPVRAIVNLQTIKRVFEINPVTLEQVREVPPGEVLALPAGYPLIFVIDVINLGPSAAAAVSFVDTFEAEASVQSSNDTCEIFSAEIRCGYRNASTGDLLPPYDGTSTTLFQTQLLTIPISGTPEGRYLNTATASTATDESTLDDNTAVRPVDIASPIADLIIDKTSATSPLVAGGAFTYQIAVSAGRIEPPDFRFSSDAEDVVVTDELPAGLVPTGATSSQGECSIAGQEVTCSLGLVRAVTAGPEPGPPALITITGTVGADVALDSVTNTAVGTSSTTLTGGASSVSDSVDTPLEQSSDLSITKVTDATAVAAGGAIAFTITVANSGPSDATDVVITDLLPDPLVFDPETSASVCELVAGEVVCDLGTIAPGQSPSVTIGARVPADAAAGSITNTATVASGTPDPDPSDDAASVDVGLIRQADLRISKTPAANAVLLGGTLGYTLVVTNDGPSDAEAVELTESIPAATSFTAPLPEGCTGADPVTCAIGDLPAGGVAVLQFTLEVPDTLQPGILENTASVESATEDPDASDNATTVVVDAVANADVTLTKEVLTTNPVAGQPLEFRLTVRNNGPTVAPNASLSDPIPVGTTFVSFTPTQGSCQLDQLEDVPAASCALGRLGVGESASAVLVVSTDPAALEVTNTGFAGSGGLDEFPEDNVATVTVRLAGENDVAVTVTADQPQVAPGDEASFTVVVVNNGPRVAAAVVLENELPAQLLPTQVVGGRGLALRVAQPLPPGCTPAGLQATCDLGDLAVGETRTLSFSGTVADGTPPGTRLVDTATVSFDGIDGVPANNSSSDATVVVALGAAPGGGSSGGPIVTAGVAIASAIGLAAVLLVAGAGLRWSARARDRRASSEGRAAEIR